MLNITHEVEEAYLKEKNFCPKCRAPIDCRTLVHKKSQKVIYGKIICPACTEEFYEIFSLVGLFTSLDKQMFDEGKHFLETEP
jgi:hypothetical protein